MTDKIEERGFWYWAWPINREPNFGSLAQLFAYMLLVPAFVLPPLFWAVGSITNPLFWWVHLWWQYWLSVK